MKKFFSYFMIAMCLLGTSVVTSCGSDDDDDELKALPYEADAALYELDYNTDKIAYIELTSAGNYFIEYKTMIKSKVATINVNDVEFSLPFATADKNITRATQDNFEYGVFERNDDGSYTLKDRSNDILTIKQENGRYTITLGGNTYTATRVNRFATFAAASQICRSWKMTNVRFKMEQDIMGMKVDIDEEASSYKDLMKKLQKYTGTSYGNVEDIDYISFNNTGSYVVKTETSIERNYWSWSGNKLFFSNSQDVGWDVTFDGSTMKMDYKKSVNTELGSSSLEMHYEFSERLF
ncbi:MAG: hypothetical protein J5735_06970 [Prevotella sp.]|nr:hypothetical protein [Prevotella sp.]